jgi:hypothetical protein
MTPNPASLRDKATVGEAVRFLTDKGCSAAAVMSLSALPAWQGIEAAAGPRGADTAPTSVTRAMASSTSCWTSRRTFMLRAAFTAAGVVITPLVARADYVESITDRRFREDARHGKGDAETAGFQADFDTKFDKAQEQLVIDALWTLYDRIFSTRVTKCYNEAFRKGGYSIKGEYLSQQDKVLQQYPASMLAFQLSRLQAGISAGRFKFPGIVIIPYCLEGGPDWGRGPVGTVSVTRDPDKSQADSSVSGEFKVYLNRWYLNATSDKVYRDRNAWAGLLFHEMLHNLGHKHPDASDPGYSRYQINLAQVALSSNGTFRLGDTGTAARCAPAKG